MSLLVVGLSHNTAPVSVIEQAALDEVHVVKLLADVISSDCVDEALVLATCNRLEVYAEVSKFHGGVQSVTRSLEAACAIDVAGLSSHLYVHYEEAAVEHLFSVAAGLDSMVIGEQQILGQLKSALALARAESTAGRVVGSATERALHAGKRVHTETGLGAAGRSLVNVGVDVIAQAMGGLTGRRVAVVGAGSISSLAATTVQRNNAGNIVILNRTPERASRLAEAIGARALDLDQLTDVLTDVDLVVSCTGASSAVIETGDVVEAVAHRGGRELWILDLALPRDVEPGVRAITGVTVVGLDDLADVLRGSSVDADIETARQLIRVEVGAWLARQRSNTVAPAVIALRDRAQAVLDAELGRLMGRLPDLDERSISEIGQAMSRTVDKLLHAPTVRIKELAAAPGGDTYAQALRDLFALDQQAPAAVARATVVVEDESADSDDGGRDGNGIRRAGL